MPIKNYYTNILQIIPFFMSKYNGVPLPYQQQVQKSIPVLKNKKEKGVKEKKILPKPLMPFSEGHTNYAV